MAITAAQKLAIKRVFDRTPLFDSPLSAQQLAMEKGWAFVARENLSPAQKDRVDPKWSHVWVHPTYTPIYADATDIVSDYALAKRLSYRAFRKTVQSGYDCLMVRWQGMWLGIEADGYTHS